MARRSDWKPGGDRRDSYRRSYTGEPFPWLSADRGAGRQFRSPWAYVVVGIGFLAIAVWAATTAVFSSHAHARIAVGIIAVVMAALGLFLAYAGVCRVRWMRSVGMNPWKPDYNAARSRRD